MNDKIYELITKILESDLPKESRNEIVRFYMLPRNTPVRPMIEIEEEESGGDIGVVKRPSQHELDRRENPKMAGAEDAARELLGKVIKPNETRR